MIKWCFYLKIDFMRFYDFFFKFCRWKWKLSFKIPLDWLVTKKCRNQKDGIFRCEWEDFQVVIRQLLVTENERKRARWGLEPYCERDASWAKGFHFLCQINAHVAHIWYVWSISVGPINIDLDLGFFWRNRAW